MLNFSKSKYIWTQWDTGVLLFLFKNRYPVKGKYEAAKSDHASKMGTSLPPFSEENR
jgi:hypothetical protein